MKYNSNKKQETGIAAQALEYVLKDVLKIEKVYTAIFIGMFVTFFYQWITYPTDEQAVSQSLLSLEAIKVCMWVSALMAIVSHLMPNGGLKK
jgi:glucan phosphoethanolaminetransferase (alkaline phosphatase superfamily)